MNKLPLETINGKQYQPVEGLGCDKCEFNDTGNIICRHGIAKCCAHEREDQLDVYFIEPGDTNEQE